MQLADSRTLGSRLFLSGLFAELNGAPRAPLPSCPVAAASLGGGGSAAKAEAKRAAREAAGEPKRPANAYMLYCAKERASFQEDNPDANIGELSKLMGEHWKYQMTDEAKLEYLSKADELKAEYDVAYAAFVANNAELAKKVKAKSAAEGTPEFDWEQVQVVPWDLRPLEDEVRPSGTPAPYELLLTLSREGDGWGWSDEVLQDTFQLDIPDAKEPQVSTHRGSNPRRSHTLPALAALLLAPCARRSLPATCRLPL